MAYSTIKSVDGLVVESELTGATLKIYDSAARERLVFSVNVTHAGDRTARLFNGYGNVTVEVKKSIRAYLKLNNFSSLTFERGNPEEGLRTINTKVA
ncbi:hypothetical protein ACM257_17695 [Alteromonas macleodii]|uniref:hypothetical protein n=1 Tax=Alteromonas macleodii TaxID=28108 RepID=UPI0039F65350